MSNYELSSNIGEGGYGVVYLGRDLHSGREVAIKSQQLNTESLNEVLVAHSICSEYLLSPSDVYYTKSNGKTTINIVMDRGVCDLRYAIRKDLIPSHNLRSIAIQMIKAIADLHRHDVVHCDVKTSNFIVFGDYDTIRLTDFGLSELSKRRGIKRYSSYTVPYRPPETFTTKVITKASDVWALGTCLFELLTGIEMFRHSYLEEEFETTYIRSVRNDREERLDVLYGSNVADPSLFRRVVDFATKHDPKERPTAENLLEMLGESYSTVYEYVSPKAIALALTDNTKAYRTSIITEIESLSKTIRIFLLAIYIFDRYYTITRRLRNAKTLAKDLVGLATIRLDLLESRRLTIGMVRIAEALSYKIECPNLLTEMVDDSSIIGNDKRMNRVKDFVLNEMLSSNDTIYYDYILV